MIFLGQNYVAPILQIEVISNVQHALVFDIDTYIKLLTFNHFYFLNYHPYAHVSVVSILCVCLSAS